MFRTKIFRVGPFILFRYYGDRGDVMDVSRNLTIREGVLYTKPNKDVANMGAKDEYFSELAHNSSQVVVRGTFEYDNPTKGLKFEFPEGMGGFRAVILDDHQVMAMTDNAIYDCWYPNDRTPRRWARVAGISNRGDILEIPEKDVPQFILLSIGEISSNEFQFEASETKPVSIRINPGQQKKLVVNADRSVWTRVWPETEAENIQEKI